MPTDLALNLKAIRETVPPAMYGNIIGTITHTYLYVSQDEKVREVAEDLKNIEGVFAIGVVDEFNKATGVLPIQYFLAQMARPYAHELLSKRPISVMMQEVRSFSWDKNILSVAEKLDHQIQQIQNQYFLLHHDDATFFGVFTTKDLLIHLYNNFKRDLHLAATIQRAVVKDHASVQSRHLEILGSSTMAKGVGGDFYQFREYASGKWVLALADVSGKGMGASLVTSLLGGMFNIYDFSQGIKRFLVNLNGYMRSAFEMEKYLTGAFLDVQEKRGEMVFYDMGHSYIYIFRKGKFLRSAANNPFVGFVPKIAPKGQSITLKKNDLVAVISDGLPEQQNSAGEEYGLSRFEHYVSEHADEPLEKIREGLMENHKAFRRDHPKGDNITLLFMRYLG